MRAIVFNKAGKIALTKYVNGALTHDAANMSIRNGTVQSIQDTASYNTTDLADGNSDWPMGSYDTGISGQVVVTMASYHAKLHAFLLGVDIANLTNQAMRENDEELLIPSASPFTATLEHAPAALMVPVLVNEEASPFVKVSATPAVGQFSVSASTVTFNSADAGKNVFITYDWTATTAESVGLPKIATRPTLYAVISGSAVSEDESTEYDANIIIDKCKVVGDINPPEKGREPKAWSFTLKVLKPRGSNKAVDTIYAQSV